MPLPVRVTLKARQSQLPSVNDAISTAESTVMRTSTRKLLQHLCVLCRARFPIPNAAGSDAVGAHTRPPTTCVATGCRRRHTIRKATTSHKPADTAAVVAHALSNFVIHIPVTIVVSLADTLVPVRECVLSIGLSNATSPERITWHSAPRSPHFNGITHKPHIQVHCDAPTTNALHLHMRHNVGTLGRLLTISTVTILRLLLVIDIPDFTIPRLGPEVVAWFLVRRPLVRHPPTPPPRPRPRVGARAA